MEQPVILLQLADAGHRGHLPVAEVAGQEQHAPASPLCALRRFDVFDPDPGPLPCGGHERQANKLDEKADEMGVVGLGQPPDFGFGNDLTEYSTKVCQYDSTPERQQVKHPLAVPGNIHHGRNAPGNRRSAVAAVGQ